MPDKINEKVINIFTRHKRELPISDDEKVVRNEDGYYYVCIKKDENGNYFDEKKLLDRASCCYYIVKIMMIGAVHPCIYNYRVPSDKILNFLTPYINKEKEGQIIGIDRHYPEELA